VGYEAQMKHERAGEATQAASTCNLEVASRFTYGPASVWLICWRAGASYVVAVRC